MATKRKIKRAKMPPLDRVKADLAAGMTPTKMQEVYGVAQSTISHFLTKNKLSKIRRLVYPADDEIIACLQNGDSKMTMAKKFGMSVYAIGHRITTRGLREKVVREPAKKPEPIALRPTPIKVIVTAPDGSKISVPRIPTLHGTYEARP